MRHLHREYRRSDLFTFLASDGTRLLTQTQHTGIRQYTCEGGEKKETACSCLLRNSAGGKFTGGGSSLRAAISFASLFLFVVVVTNWCESSVHTC